MGKTNKLALRYGGGTLPADLSELLQNADENDLRILVAALMAADRESGTVEVDRLHTLLEMERADVEASLKFWRGAGVLTLPRASRKSETKPTAEAVAKTEAEKKPAVAASAHRGGALERSGIMEGYSSAELAELMESRRVSTQFIDEAQRVMGKIFRTYDTGILVGIVDRLGFEEAAVLTLLTYAAGRGKKTLRYVEQMAMALYDEGITDTTAVIDRISRMERSGEVIGKIKSLFGTGDRELTTAEKKFFTAWTEKMVYDIEVIRMAYEITVDTIGQPKPAYTNGILEKWHAEGVRNADDARAFLEKRKTESGEISTAKSYDLSDFVDAALRRSYGDLN